MSHSPHSNPLSERFNVSALTTLLDHKTICYCKVSHFALFLLCPNSCFVLCAVEGCIFQAACLDCDSRTSPLRLVGDEVPVVLDACYLG